jgi:hypothetical protein
VRSLEDQIAFLRRELERKDTILLNLTERIPQLEPPSEASPEAGGSPKSAEEQQGRGSVSEAAQEQERPAERPWWRRMFGG